MTDTSQSHKILSHLVYSLVSWSACRQSFEMVLDIDLQKHGSLFDERIGAELQETWAILAIIHTLTYSLTHPPTRSILTQSFFQLSCTSWRQNQEIVQKMLEQEKEVRQGPQSVNEYYTLARIHNNKGTIVYLHRNTVYKVTFSCAHHCTLYTVFLHWYTCSWLDTLVTCTQCTLLLCSFHAGMSLSDIIGLEGSVLSWCWQWWSLLYTVGVLLFEMVDQNVSYVHYVHT